jgi:solute carrier family 45, member 1/2/4
MRDRFTWGIEMTYCTPYLLKLGLTKSRVSLVWIAGPLSGLIVQPLVGVMGDRSRSPYGRRRPFMIAGSIVVSLCLLTLGWTAEVIRMLITEKKSTENWTLILAVLSIYGIDFAINAVQAAARSLIMDTLPSSKQQSASAWASRMVAVGHLLGYAAGAMDLTRFFGSTLGDTQFKQLIIVSIMALIGTVGLSCWAVDEKVLVSRGEADAQDEFRLIGIFSSLFHTATSLPQRVATVCWIQFWSWIGWFPFLFYSTTWIGEVYLRFNASEAARDHHDSLAQVGQVGSMSLVVFSIVTLVASVIVPPLIETTEDSNVTPRPPAAIASVLLKIRKCKPTLLTAWTYSHVIFAVSMICTPFVTSLHAATTLIALCGM